MKKYLEILIKVLFLILVFGICLVNLRNFTFSNSKIFFYSFLIIVFSIVIMYLYKKKFIKKNILYIFFATIFIMGIIIRIYFINNLEFSLSSDFQFVFENAKAILNNTLDEIGTIDYLSYNGYSYIYSYIIMIIFKIFGTSIDVILHFNTICQIISAIMLYKIIKINNSKESALMGALTFFMLPTIVCANLLISTETPFILMFFITLYVFYKIIDKKELKIKNILSFLLLGILMSITNYIRPVMTIFVIALIIYYIINMKHLKEIILLIVILISYSITGTLFNTFIENSIGTETRSGALGWSIYFGSNYEYCGSWSPEDSEYVSKVLEDRKKGDKDLILLSLKRYNEYGIIKTTDLMMCKYNSLWVNNVGTYGFVKSIIDNSKTKIDFNKFDLPFSNISKIIVIILCIGSIIAIIQEHKNNKNTWIFLELFGLGYILSNFLVCLNGRYNLPLYPILIICCMPLFDKLFIPTKKEIKIHEINKNNKQKVLLIIPAYNEEESIKNTVEKVISKGYDYIIINDGSIDNTKKICIENKFNHINLISNLGIGGAVQTGYKYALENDYDIAIQFDADGQHDINHINTLIKPILEGKAHFTIGSRFINESTSEFKSTKLRQIGIKMISWIIYEYSGKKIYDTTSGFRASNKEIIKRFASNYPLEYPEPISTFELIKDGYIIEEVPVEMHSRVGGKSSIMSWKKAYYMFNVFFSIIIAQIRSER